VLQSKGNPAQMIEVIRYNCAVWRKG